MDIQNTAFNRCNTIPVLPTSFNDALSYYECISQVAAKVNEVIDYVNQYQSAYKEYTDEAIKGVKAELQGTLEKQNKVLADYSKNIEQFKADSDAAFVKFTGEVNAALETLRGDIAVNLVEAKGYTDEAVKANNDKIYSDLAKEVSNIKVTNPITGERTGIQELFDYLANLHVTNGITVAELTARNITVSELTNLGITVEEMTRNGGTLIPA